MFEADLLLVVADAGINQATTPSEVLPHVSEVIPFIELPDLVLAEGEPMSGPILTAINVGARQGVLGPRIAAEQSDGFLQSLADMEVKVLDERGEQLALAKGEAVLGHPLNSVIWLVERAV